REPVVRAPTHRDASMLGAELPADANELLLVRLLGRVQVCDAPVERGERERRILQWSRSRVSARRQRARDSDRRDKVGAGAGGGATHPPPSLRRLASAAAAPSTAPSVTMPAATGHGRNEGATPTSDASSSSSRPRTTRKSAPSSAIAPSAP